MGGRAFGHGGVGLPAVCIADLAQHQSPSDDGHGAG
jgi:hypothetical protein